MTTDEHLGNKLLEVVAPIALAMFPSKAALARALGLSRANVANTLTGDRNVSVEKVARMAAQLGIAWNITADGTGEVHIVAASTRASP